MFITQRRFFFLEYTPRSVFLECSSACNVDILGILCLLVPAKLLNDFKIEHFLALIVSKFLVQGGNTRLTFFLRKLFFDPQGRNLKYFLFDFVN